MFDQTVQRIGFCCKYLDPDQSQPARVLKEIQSQYTERGTTVAWLNRQKRSVAEQRCLEIAQHNIQAATNLITHVGSLPENLRHVRLGSNQLPVATQEDWRYIWQDSDNRRWLESGWRQVGDLARELDVRLSMHPGQFCVIASDRPDVVERSIDEFEYHADLIRWMGYGERFQDFMCNVHISGKRGAQGILDVLPRLSPEARNTITIENDEFGWGLDESLKLKDHVALVLDIHHHWIREGEYIQPDDDRFQQVIDSWRGVRPAIHYSYSRCEHLPENHEHRGLTPLNSLLEAGCKRTKLRAHSDMYPNPDANRWALSFLPWADIEAEAKMKNLASRQLYEQWKRDTDNIQLQNWQQHTGEAAVC